MYAGSKPALAGLPILPHKDDHYALVITVDPVMAPDEVSLEMEVGGGAGDMRYAGIGQYSTGNNLLSPWSARPCRRLFHPHLSELQQAKRVAGRFQPPLTPASGLPRTLPSTPARSEPLRSPSRALNVGAEGPRPAI